jgi:hypothetical protein
MKRTSEYTRLSWRGTDHFGFRKSNLWLGNDHLLQVRLQGMTEEYMRFYYRDIHAIFLQKNSKFLALNLIFSVISLALLVILVFAARVWSWQPAPLIAWTVLTVFFLSCLLINIVRGSTCNCYLHTAVHRERLPSLKRVRSSLKALSALSQRIEAVQGSLAAEQLIRISQEPKRTEQLVFTPGVQAKVSAQDSRHYYGGAAHFSFFILLIVNGLQAALHIFYHSLAFSLVNTGLNLLMLLFMIFAILRQRQSTMGKPLRSLVWYSLGYFLIKGICLSGYQVFYAMLHVGTLHTPWDIYRDLVRLSALDSPPLLAILIFSSAVSLILGATGLVLLQRYRSEQREGSLSWQNQTAEERQP